MHAPKLAPGNSLVEYYIVHLPNGGIDYGTCSVKGGLTQPERQRLAPIIENHIVAENGDEHVDWSEVWREFDRRGELQAKEPAS